MDLDGGNKIPTKLIRKLFCRFGEQRAASKCLFSTSLINIYEILPAPFALMTLLSPNTIHTSANQKVKKKVYSHNHTVNASNTLLTDKLYVLRLCNILIWCGTGSNFNITYIRYGDVRMKRRGIDEMRLWKCVESNGHRMGKFSVKIAHIDVW